MNSFRGAALIGALLACTAWPASARTVIFDQCDGYGTPSGDGDGMSKPATQLFGLIGTLGSAGNTRRSTPDLGAQGIASCDQALADPRLLEKFWLRRASLLRARAVHDLAAGSGDDALADLDRSAAAIQTPNDPFVKRSMALGIDFVRAAALIAKGDRERGLALAEAVHAQRPFDRHLSLATLALINDDHSPLGETVAHDTAGLDPRLVSVIFESAFDRGDFAAVVALYPQLVAPTRTADVGVSKWEGRVQDARRDGEEVAFGAKSGGIYAYSLAALGRMDEARAALAEARSSVTAGTPAEMAPVAEGEKEGSKARLQRTMNEFLVRTGKKSSELLESWARAIELRATLATADPAKASEEILQSKIPSRGVAFDLVHQLVQRLPQDEKLKELAAQVDAAQNRAPKVDAKLTKLIFQALPHSEIAQRVATYRKANSDFIGYLWGGVSGFKTVEGDGPDFVTVKFTGEKSSSSVVEEMTLLRAADLARERGKSGFVILERRDYERTVNTTYYGSTLRSDPQGYSCDLDIELVDLNALPSGYKSVPWRVVSADKVIATLGPIYMNQPSTAAAR
jgi:hypothetical protein